MVDYKMQFLFQKISAMTTPKRGLFYMWKTSAACRDLTVSGPEALIYLACATFVTNQKTLVFLEGWTT